MRLLLGCGGTRVDRGRDRDTLGSLPLPWDTSRTETLRLSWTFRENAKPPVSQSGNECQEAHRCPICGPSASRGHCRTERDQYKTRVHVSKWNVSLQRMAALTPEYYYINYLYSINFQFPASKASSHCQDSNSWDFFFYFIFIGLQIVLFKHNNLKEKCWVVIATYPASACF